MKTQMYIYRLLTGIIFGTLMMSSQAILQAQDAGFAGGSFHLGYSARGMGMGNAMSAVTSQGVYSYYNPALSALRADRRQADLSIASMSFDRFLQTAGVHFQLPPSAGLSILILHTGVKDIDGRSISGYPTGRFDAADFQLRGDFGIRLSTYVHAGIGIKFSLADHHPELENASSFGLDLGILVKSSNALTFAITIKDLFAGYNWNSQGLYGLDQAQNTLNQFPTRITFGSAYQKSIWTISADFEYLISKADITTNQLINLEGFPSYQRTTDEVTTTLSRLRFGSSVDVHDRVTLRAGLGVTNLEKIESWNVSTGFSLHLPFDYLQPSIDYAFVKEPYRVSNMHVFTLRLNL